MVNFSFPFYCGKIVKCFIKPIGAESKVGQVIDIFSCSKAWISIIVSNSNVLNIVAVRFFFHPFFSAVTSSISCLGRRQSEPFIKLPALVVGMITALILSGVLASDSPKCIKFGLSVMTELRPKSMPQQEFMSAILLAIFATDYLTENGRRMPIFGK